MTQREERGFSSRNGLWMCGCGCLTLLLVPVGCAGLVWFVFTGAVGSFSPWNDALERLNEDPRATAALGEPIETAPWSGDGRFGGSFDAGIRIGDDKASLRIPVGGPRGRGTLHVEAEKDASGEWSYERLELVVEGGATRIDLLVPEMLDTVP